VEFAPALNAHFMAFAAGAMLFVSMHELIPPARRCRHISMFLWGMVVSMLVYWLLAAITVGYIKPVTMNQRAQRAASRTL
jgi:ZIP family zinc transporter